MTENEPRPFAFSSGQFAEPVDAEVLADVHSAPPPVRARELLALVLLVVAADVAMYRGHGYAGMAMFFIAAPLLLLVGAPRPRWRPAVAVVGAMLLVVAARLVWCGSPLAIASGFALTVALAMALAGITPYALDALLYAFSAIPAGYEGLMLYRRAAAGSSPRTPRVSWLNIGLPLAALLGFGTLFIMANPDLVTWVSTSLERLVHSARRWLLEIAPTWQEVLLWIAVAWISIGLLRPTFRQTAELLADAARLPEAPAESPLYSACRNTLVTVIALFAVYLVFEYKTLWFRVFPQGFYYSGYAHEGAFWLTVALALATAVLSAMFRGRVLGDPRLRQLSRLAWIWSAENMILALAVYNRLHIYVGFNGMTRMRVVGLLGISAVVVGFVLVIVKIARRRNFLWLFRRHLWTVAAAVFLYAVLPVDMLVHTYNVRRILAGDPAPSVQISVHPIAPEGFLVLAPLTQSRDPIIREGIRAMLAEQELAARQRAADRRRLGWTAFQLADRLLLDRLRATRSDWAPYATAPARRAAALERFHDYAYQWY